MATAIVASTTKTPSGTSSAIDSTGANLLLLFVHAVSGVPSVSDSKSNTWYQLGNSTVTTATTVVFYAFGSSLSVGSSHTATVSSFSNAFEFVAVSGADTQFGLALGPPRNNSTATSIAAGSITPNIDNCLVFSVATYRDTTAMSINGGFTILHQNVFAAGSAAGGGTAYLQQTTAAAANPTWSWTNSTGNSAMTVVVRPVTSTSSGGAAAYAFAG